MKNIIAPGISVTAARVSLVSARTFAGTSFYAGDDRTGGVASYWKEARTSLVLMKDAP